LARPENEPAYQVQPEPADIPPGPWALAQPAAPAYSALQQLAAYPSASQAPVPPVQAREGDMIVRADGTEQPAEPRLISEWSADTGAWQAIDEEQAPARQYESPAAPQYGAPAKPRYTTAPEPARSPAGSAQALEDYARTATAHEEAHARPEAVSESPVPSAQAQRLSAKQIYAALYGKGNAILPAAGVTGPAEQAVPVAPAPAQPAVLGRARCAGCKGIIPIYSAERPLRIKCPGCGIEGMIK
jgi:hypothetical protein